MKKIFYLIATLTVAFGTASCMGMLDDEIQHGAITADQYYANANDDEALALIVSVYNSAFGTRGGMDSYTGDIASAGAFQDTNADNFGGGLNFTTLYQINYKCNLIIENLPATSDAKKRVVAEAYFFRGWAFYNLIRGWGTPPLVDHVLSADELQPANGDVTALWKYVQDSFDQAIAVLPSKAGKDGQRAIGGRVTKETALAYKGKAYLYAGDKAAAAAALKQVIESDKYDLIANYSDLYSVKADFSPEYVWEYNVADDNVDMRATEAKITYQNNWRVENITMPGGVHLTGFNMGFSTTAPSANFYKFLADRGELGKNRQMGTAWSIEDAAQMFVTLSGKEYEGTGIYEGDHLKPLVESGLTPEQAGMTLLWSDNFGNPMLASNEGYLNAKVYFWAPDAYPANGGTDLYSKANYPVMRYSDVLLLYAEATVDNQEGLAALNKVRTRAGLAPLASYTLKDIQDERRAEFYGEGERWFDLVRWGIAKEVATANEAGKFVSDLAADKATYSYKIQSTPNSNFRGWNDRYLKFPYPTSELAQNPNLKQNPGW